MSTFPSIQFYGIDQVIEAAKNRACPGWGIFTGRPPQFLFKYEQNDLDNSLKLLEQILVTLDNTGSEAAYTIKFYEHDGGKLLRIKENLACDGSFNFRLIEEEERQQRKIEYRGASNKLLEKLEAIETRLAQIETGTVEEQDEEDNTLQGQLIGMLKEPSRLTEFINALSSAKSLLGIGPAPSPGYVGNTDVIRAGQIPTPAGSPAPPAPQDLSHLQPTKGLTSMYDQQESSEALVHRLGIAINTLEKNDPKIVDHLEKLAAMSDKNPDQFKTLLSILETM